MVSAKLLRAEWQFAETARKKAKSAKRKRQGCNPNRLANVLRHPPQWFNDLAGTADISYPSILPLSVQGFTHPSSHLNHFYSGKLEVTHAMERKIAQGRIIVS